MKTVIVTGDISVQWRFAQDRSVQDVDFELYQYQRTELYREYSGATILGRIISDALRRLESDGDETTRVVFPDASRLLDVERGGPYWDYYVTCAQFPKRNDSSDNELAWRIAAKLAVDRKKDAPNLNLIPEDTGNGDVVVVYDANQGFSLSEDAWPRSFIEPGRDASLLIRWSGPGGARRDRFWHHVVKRFSPRIVVVTTVDDLRLSGMRISRSLSWERTVEDLYREVTVALKLLGDSLHFVVSFGTSGAVLFTSGEGGLFSATLIYDPGQIEGNWNNQYRGTMRGYTNSLMSGIAVEMARNGGFSEFRTAGITAGLIASRNVLQEGFVAHGHSTQYSGLPQSLLFPAESTAVTVADALMRPSSTPFQTVLVPTNLESTDSWRIIDALADGLKRTFEGAYEIITFGTSSRAWSFPTARIGKLFVADRNEIETLRTIHELFENYINAPLGLAPFSIAVFGSPGSGKSFAIKELASDLSGSQKIPVESLTFNLSQFNGPEEIAIALQQVRDIGVLGHIPLVFWDEFDSTYGTRLGWLRYFLAPMQDGEFRDGSMSRKIGRAAFVFAGGTNATMHEFLAEVQAMDARAAREAKVPDFISRLKGFVDIPSLDHGVHTDRANVLRRAEMLRALLLSSASHLVEEAPWPNDAGGYAVQKRIRVDPGLVYAFMAVRRFRYGARSMEAIVRMSAIGGKNAYDLSSLPPREQLALHVDPDEFLDLTTRSPLRHPLH